MNKKKTKIQGQYTDRGYGFPIVLRRVPMVKIRGRWTPQIDYNVLARGVLTELTQLKGRLSGDQIKFIRLQLAMTLQEFATRLGVTHPAVLKWEKSGSKTTGMNWSTEKDIRLFIVKTLHCGAKELFQLYVRLEDVMPEKIIGIELDGELLAA